MQKYLIYIIFLLLSACNSNDETNHDKNQNNKLDSDSSNFNVSGKQDFGNIDNEIQAIEGKTHQVKSISELWNTYKTSKAEAIKNYELGNLSLMIKNYETSANAAIDLSREDLAVWQLNNIGHFSIEVFTKKTDYQNRLRTLAITGNQIQKEAYYKETKEVFIQYYQLLLEAEPYLQKGSLLDKKYKYSERTQSINSNLKFINWIRKYLRDGLT